MTIIRCPYCGALHEAETWRGFNFVACPEVPNSVAYLVAKDYIRIENMEVAG